MTMEELERKILNQGSLNTSTMRSVEEIEAELTGAHLGHSVTQRVHWEEISKQGY